MSGHGRSYINILPVWALGGLGLSQEALAGKKSRQQVIYSSVRPETPSVAKAAAVSTSVAVAVHPSPPSPGSIEPPWHRGHGASRFEPSP
jgi:hypothetical protein